MKIEKINIMHEIENTLDQAMRQLNHSEIAFGQWIRIARKFTKKHPELSLNDLLPNKFNETLMKRGIIKEPIFEIVRNKRDPVAKNKRLLPRKS